MKEKTTYKFYQDLGICPQCRKVKLWGEEKICPECLAYHSKMNIKYYKIHGRKDKEIHKERNRQEYQRRIENGICPRCGKFPLVPQRKKCAKCLEKDAIRSMLYRERKLALQN